jgi:RNAse (barnase) inhibitor barstar
MSHMATGNRPQPEWFRLSHHDRYRKLQIVRRRWCRRRFRESEDRPGRTVCLDGTWITDVPSFYLSLGEAVNGPNGYFGACLDAFADCLTGGFGVWPPLTIRLSDYDRVRSALDGRVWCRFRAESFREAVDSGESTEQLADWGYFDDGDDPEDVARWTATYEAAFAGEPFDCGDYGSYFDAILEVVKRSKAELVPDDGDSDGA